MADRTKKTRAQLELRIGVGKQKPTGPERTLEVNCSNCGAKFVAYYGYDEENVESRFSREAFAAARRSGRS